MWKSTQTYHDSWQHKHLAHFIWATRADTVPFPIVKQPEAITEEINLSQSTIRNIFDPTRNTTPNESLGMLNSQFPPNNCIIFI